jgi:hypothetical protein
LLSINCRIDAIKAKQATRAAAGGSVEVLTAAGTSSSRVFSKHVAIPIPATTSQRAGSTGSTPQGSPARREAVLEAQLASLPKLETPPIWQGFQVRARAAQLYSKSSFPAEAAPFRAAEKMGWVLWKVCGVTLSWHAPAPGHPP